MYHYRRQDRVRELYRPSSIVHETIFRSISIRIGRSLSMTGLIRLHILLLISINIIIMPTTRNPQHTHTQSTLFPTVSSPTPPPHSPPPPHPPYPRAHIPGRYRCLRVRVQAAPDPETPWEDSEWDPASRVCRPRRQSWGPRR
ncbi:hypothetical protein Hypma_009944 [Hypsizygus marmoreus]|uniref:Uncharacterized protein n=1 Tax=Hypsizygus marmoreus TaxID=39966 RepID=A0A369JL77_HYPMA|nr:hypothetical protein Hypma_009944 [Hypsizygus marmoreus]